jgi:hypothetical protein
MVSEFNDVVVSGLDVSKASKKATVSLEGGGLDPGWYKLPIITKVHFLR